MKYDLENKQKKQKGYLLLIFTNIKLIIMTKKKTNSKKTVEEPLLEKIAGKLGNITGELIVAKNNLVEMAGGAIDSVKETIYNITAKKPAHKKAVKVVAKKAVKAATKKVVKKAAPAKKAVKAVAKKIVKKAAPVKKAIKKTVKKTATVTRGIRRR